jgi:hypothetical protein
MQQFVVVIEVRDGESVSATRTTMNEIKRSRLVFGDRTLQQVYLRQCQFRIISIDDDFGAFDNVRFEVAGNKITPVLEIFE